MKCSICDRDGFEAINELRAHQLEEHPGERGKSPRTKRTGRGPGRPRKGDAPELAAALRATDTPPPKDRAPRGSRPSSLEKRLRNFVGSVAFGVSMLGDDHCASHLLNTAEPFAAAWTRAAAEHAWLKQFLESMLKGSALMEATSATAIMVYPILVHHGYAPAVRLPFASEAEQPVEPESVAPTANGNGSAGLVG